MLKTQCFNSKESVALYPARQAYRRGMWGVVKAMVVPREWIWGHYTLLIISICLLSFL